MTTIRCLLVIALHRRWELHQIDVNNAFLYGDLDEEIYMRFPQGYSFSGSNRVCRLRNSLYGLRQASRNCFAEFTNTLRSYGFAHSLADYSSFTYKSGDDFLIVLIYVDDLIIAGNNPSRCAAFKSYLHTCFRIKDLGPLKYF